MNLCRYVYHCLPSELDEEEWSRIATHLAILDGEITGRQAAGGRG